MGSAGVGLCMKCGGAEVRGRNGLDKEEIRGGGRSGADCTPCSKTLDISGDEILGWEMLGKGKRGEKEGRDSRGEEGVGQSTEKGMTRSGRMIEGRVGKNEKG